MHNPPLSISFVATNSRNSAAFLILHSARFVDYREY